MKPMLASDYAEDRVQYPVIGQPKIDGVRGLNMHGGLTGRSLKLFKNRFTTQFYSKDFFKGFDGELAAHSETHSDLCRLTTSAVGTIAGEPFTLWWLFDYVTPQNASLDYWSRYTQLCLRVAELQADPSCMPWAGHLRIVPYVLLHDAEDLREYREENLRKGYEGTILRQPDRPHKQGRSTVREGGLLRIKDFIDSEAMVESITQGESNHNEAQVNELGNQFRSTHQANMVPNGLVGNMGCRAIHEVKDGNRVVIRPGDPITVSPGNMDHASRKHYFEHPDELIGKVIKFKFFPKGIKDKPRFPTFVSIRTPEDM